MKLALIQQHATKNSTKNVEQGIKAFQAAAEAGAELIAYAELGLSYFLPQNPATSESVAKAERIPGPVIEKFQKLAAHYGGFWELHAWPMLWMAWVFMKKDIIHLEIMNDSCIRQI